MSRRLPPIGLLGVAALGAALGLGASCDNRALMRRDGTRTPTAQPAAATPTLRVYYLVDLDGYLEPCGCQTRPLGGIDRLATLLASERARAPRSVLVAAGDMFFEHPQVEERMVYQERAKAESLVRILDELRLAAFAPGPADYALGADAWRSLTTALRARPLVANGAGAAGGAHIHDADGVRVGIVGVSDFRPGAGDAPASAPATEDPVAAARRAVADARGRGAQVVVVLASVPRRTARAVAAAAGADFVVAAREESTAPPPPERVGGAYLLTAMSQGRSVGVLDLHLRGDGAFQDASEATRAAERARLDARIRDLRERVAQWERDPATDRAAVATQRRRLAELERARASLAGAARPTRGRFFDARTLEVAPELPRQPAVERAIATYFRAVNEHNRVAYASLRAPAAPAGTAHYVGAEACQECHAEAWDVWRATPHGRAYHTIEAVSKNFNLSCVGCHVTGYRQPGGSEVVQNEGLRDVQCESCHGPGSLHAEATTRAQRRATIRREVPGAFCASQCHTPEHSDHFDYARYLPRILGPGHGLPLDEATDGGAARPTDASGASAPPAAGGAAAH